MDSALPVSDLYLYAYPLLLMDIARKQVVAASVHAGCQEPFGRFVHERALPGVTCAPAAYPNLDTLSSSASVDLHEGPVVFRLPDTHGRYYWMSICDHGGMLSRRSELAHLAPRR